MITYKYNNKDKTIIIATNTKNKVSFVFEKGQDDFTEIVNSGVDIELSDFDPEKIKKNHILKRNKKANYKVIKVEVNGNVFNGDENSQTKMTNAIIASLTDKGTFDLTKKIDWKLADNTIKNVSILQLKKALKLAVDKQTEILLSE